MTLTVYHEAILFIPKPVLTVSHVFDECVGSGAVFETDRIADLLSESTAELLRHSLCHRHGRHTTRLRTADLTPGGVARFRQVLQTSAR